MSPFSVAFSRVDREVVKDEPPQALRLKPFPQASPGWSPPPELVQGIGGVMGAGSGRFGSDGGATVLAQGGKAP
jgi:hypothetical protein